MHESLLSGHFGEAEDLRANCPMLLLVWSEGDSDLWVEKCDTFASVKKPPQKLWAPPGTMPVGAPLDRLATDILGPLPLMPRGNKYILLVTNHFSKWVEIFPVPDQMPTTCADVMLNEEIARYGSPLSIHSDQGKNYESKVFANLCHLLEICKTRMYCRNPRGNRQAEWFN